MNYIDLFNKQGSNGYQKKRRFRFLEPFRRHEGGLRFIKGKVLRDIIIILTLMGIMIFIAVSAKAEAKHEPLIDWAKFTKEKQPEVDLMKCEIRHIQRDFNDIKEKYSKKGGESK